MRSALAVVSALAAVTLGAACGGDGGDPAQHPPPEFFGVVADDAFAGTPAYRREMLARQREAGIGLIRQTFDWSTIETAPGRYDFAAYDRLVGDAAKAGIEILPLLFRPPEFRSAAPRVNPRRGTYPPRDFRDMAEFAQRLVERYGPDGRFWGEHPETPAKPIRSWQVWNEPSFPVYWPAGPDPAEYTRLLEVTARAIRRADPEAEIVAAGLPHSKHAVPVREFVVGMHEAGAEAAYDVLAIHAYAPDAAGALRLVEDGRRLLDDLGSDAQLWVTEFGWATQGPDSPFNVGTAGQARQIGDFIAGVVERREALGLRGLVYYKWTDTGRYPGGPDSFGLHSGLLRRDRTEKPGLDAFRRASRPD